MHDADAPGPPYRVLSLDGGGTWAVIQVKTLIRLFGAETLGHDVLAKFNLAVANSGGSVILASLAVNHRLLDILSLYIDERKRRSAFRPTPCEWMVRKIGGGLLPYPRYSTKKKRAALSNYLGPNANVLLSRWQGDHPRLANLVITAFDYDVKRAAFFRTNTASLAGSQSASGRLDATLLDAVNASANPPVLYFDKPARVQLANEHRWRRYWDGAVAGYNNPAMAAVVEALADREAYGAKTSRASIASGVSDERVGRRPIHILSIGTGTVHRPRRPVGIGLCDPRFIGGEPECLVRDVQALSDAIVDDPPDAATFVAHVTLGGSLPRSGEVVTEGPIVRMNPVVRPVLDGLEWKWLPGLGDKEWARLTTLGLDALAQDDIELVMRLCDAWLSGGVRNQPIRPRDDNLDAEIGHDNFVDALRAFPLPPAATTRVENSPADTSPR
ncbi:MAG TPA: patatin-like phospholipase family protein [Polyangiaceae bacterium]|jgi:hypothetical protein|nr:patatin-like phospholipase family protein [Polyangiaceae bacterium]